MNRKRLNKIIKVTIMTIAMSAIGLFSGAFDASASQNIEKEFIDVVNKYKNEKVIVEEGVSLRKGESLNLSQYKGWELSNENTLEIDESGIAKVKDSGTVFLSNKIGDNVYIVEVYVPSVVKANYSLKNTVVDRDYYKVFIDPGHGGADNGAAGNGLLEDELTLQISLKVKEKLREKGIQVQMSRESDVYVGLGERAEMANGYGADILVSPHINSFTSSSAKGIETYYHTDKSGHRPLSNNIQENAARETGAANRGVKSANFAVLRESSMPSSLFEAGFISNPEEAAKLATADYQHKLAKALADGIESYLKENVKLNGAGGEVTPPPVTPEENAKTGIVTASSLNVRSGAGTSYSTIGSLKNGAKVEIVETTGSWHKIKYGSGHGYVSIDYVKVSGGETTPPTNPEPPTTSGKKGTVTGSSLNVRSGAGTNHLTIGSLKKGATVEIISTSGGWHKIKYGSGHGYVSADYVKVSGGETTPPTNPEPPTTSGKKGTVTGSSLNVRARAGTNHSTIGSLKKGATVEIISTSGGWHKIKYGNGHGYVSTDYVKVAGGETAPPTNPEPPTTSGKKGTITASSLNVRSGAGTNHSTIGSLKNGATVEIISTSGGWHKIKFGGGYGYVSTDYVKVSGGGNTSNPGTSQEKTGTITASSLNVRAGAGTSSKVIGSLSKGSKVTVVSTSGGWHKIKYGNGYGYISSDYVRF